MFLICRQPDGKETKIRLKPISHAPAVTLGRGAEATICLEDAQCSRIHCAIRYWDDIFIIRDMKSSNGTFVNGQKIVVCQVSPGDKVQIGNTNFRLEPEETSMDVTMRA